MKPLKYYREHLAERLSAYQEVFSIQSVRDMTSLTQEMLRIHKFNIMRRKCMDL